MVEDLGAGLYRWEDNMKIYFTEMEVRVWTGFSWLAMTFSNGFLCPWL
jgi:hypothetical protein